MNNKILETQPTEENPFIVNNYPYGRSRTQIRYWIESVKRKGDRFVSQTLNPKTKEWNKPKKSTYNAVMVAYLDEKEHLTYKGLWRSTNKDDYLEFMEFVGDLELNEIQKEELRVMRSYIKAYSGVEFECVGVTGNSFLDDEEKMRDFKEIGKDEFLKSYSYLTEEDYKATEEAIKQKEIQETINRRIAVSYQNDEGGL